LNAPPTTLTERVALVWDRIAQAARRVGRNPESILLVAVTKTHGFEVIEAAYRAGLQHFGENRVEEAESKIMMARTALPPDVTWHMIGHIQSRKTADVARLCDWVHSVDRLKIARRLNEAASQSGRRLETLLEVNLSGEESKYGYDLSRWPDDASQLEVLVAEIEAMQAMSGLHLRGLMTMAPLTAEPEEARPIFRRLRLLRETLQERFPDLRLTELSMGMSGDFEVAVEEGATIVRLGTILFGPRED
jgi:pyridoxal phosphate enzyme (YggS family)